MKVFFLIIYLAVAHSACFSVPTDGLYLIPEGYTGAVIVLFDQPDGIVPEVENGLYVYRIHGNGILKVRTKGPRGIVSVSYYYVNENNERQKIDRLRVTGETDPQGHPQNKYGNISSNDFENKIFVLNPGGLGSFNTPSGVVQYTSFIVGTPKDGDRFTEQKQDRISKLQQDLIRGN